MKRLHFIVCKSLVIVAIEVVAAYSLFTGQRGRVCI
jgi:hypothetical protein